MDNTSYLDTCQRAAKEGGQQLLAWRGRCAVRAKAPADLVTEADLASQERIRQVVGESFPDHGFVGEESTAESQRVDSDYCWIVDPLDGTTNYVHGFPYFCVSVALLYQGEPLVGTVFDPVRNECFTAVRGAGAALNGVPVHCSDVASLDEALVVASFPASIAPGAVEVERFLRMLYASRSLRRLGAAALNLSYLAAGRLDGYWATTVKSWDVAAGVLLVREAGGVVTGWEEDSLNVSDPRLIAAATPALHREMGPILRAL